LRSGADRESLGVVKGRAFAMPSHDMPQSTQPTHQATLTALAEVVDEAGVRAALAAFPKEAFAAPSLGIHFARLLLVPRDPQGAPSASWLALETNFDATADDDATAQAAQLGALAGVAREALSGAFRHCKGFTQGAALAPYLEARLLASTAAYQGHPYHDLARIKLEQRVREVIMEWLETAPNDPPGTLFDAIRRHVRAQSRVDPVLGGLDVDAPAPSLPDPAVRSEHLREKVWPWLANVGVALPIIPHLPSVAYWDRRDATYDVRTHQEAWTPADMAEFAAISASEDHGMQNALSHVVPVRAGLGRLAVLKSAHAYIAAVAKNHFAYVGNLGGIPTIHFAKWLLIDEGSRLLFFSNYDGSWESYLGDFIDQAADGLNVAWSCTRQYPKTKMLAFEGAKDEETFKAWGRDCQMPTQVFYSAYPDLSIQAINNNTWIRYRLHQEASAGGLETWFRRLT
jgi:hypothetical protein